MPELQILQDKARLEAYLRTDPDLHLYHLGDLDEFFWPLTTWYAWLEGDCIRALALLYTGEEPPVLLALENDNPAEMAALLESLLPRLPRRVYAHLSPGLEALFQPRYTPTHSGKHYKMTLTDPGRLAGIDTQAVFPLTPASLEELQTLYAAAYPGNWFTPRMLETGQYVGQRDRAGLLVCAAGVHVYSAEFGVAALGNITTHPEYRRRGLAAVTTAGCCKRLLETVDLIGLNVRADNAAAIQAYQKIGFEIGAVYHEWRLEPKDVLGASFPE